MVINLSKIFLFHWDHNYISQSKDFFMPRFVSCPYFLLTELLIFAVIHLTWAVFNVACSWWVHLNQWVWLWEYPHSFSVWLSAVFICKGPSCMDPYKWGKLERTRLCRSPVFEEGELCIWKLLGMSFPCREDFCVCDIKQDFWLRFYAYRKETSKKKAIDDLIPLSFETQNPCWCNESDLSPIQ